MQAKKVQNGQHSHFELYQFIIIQGVNSRPDGVSAICRDLMQASTVQPGISSQMASQASQANLVSKLILHQQGCFFGC